MGYTLTHLQELESEAMYVIREAQAQFESPAILFSGGKDSIVVVHLAQKAFYPAPLPFPLLHIDTGHNFEETIRFRDQIVKEGNLKLIVGSVQEGIDEGIVTEEKGSNPNRNVIQTGILLQAIREHALDAAIGGARRDEEKARAKERFFSFRDEFGQWNPKGQRPELWNIFNTKHFEGEHFRIFPLSNWTELDVWKYIHQESIAIPHIYFAHRRKVVKRNGAWLPVSNFMKLRENEEAVEKKVRFRTLGDITITGGIESDADSLEKIILEVATAVTTERGNREDDKRSESSMEDRKREGYF